MLIVVAVRVHITSYIVAPFIVLVYVATIVLTLTTAVILVTRPAPLIGSTIKTKSANKSLMNEQGFLYWTETSIAACKKSA